MQILRIALRAHFAGCPARFVLPRIDEPHALPWSAGPAIRARARVGRNALRLGSVECPLDDARGLVAARSRMCAPKRYTEDRRKRRSRPDESVQYGDDSSRPRSACRAQEVETFVDQVVIRVGVRGDIGEDRVARRPTRSRPSPGPRKRSCPTAYTPRWTGADGRSDPGADTGVAKPSAVSCHSAITPN